MRLREINELLGEAVQGLAEDVSAPKFKVGDKVNVVPERLEGVVKAVGEYAKMFKSYSYQVKTEDGKTVSKHGYEMKKSMGRSPVFFKTAKKYVSKLKPGETVRVEAKGKAVDLKMIKRGEYVLHNFPRTAQSRFGNAIEISGDLAEFLHMGALPRGKKEW